MGGLTNWEINTGSYIKPTTPYIQSSSHSPIKLGTSKPHWVLAADPLIKMGGGIDSATETWAEDYVEINKPGDARNYIYKNCPPHKKGKRAAGANEVFIDGSAAWRSTDKFPFYHFNHRIGYYGDTWSYWSQDLSDSDFKNLDILITIPSIILKQ
jgi:hypothetical protein